MFKFQPVDPGGIGFLDIKVRETIIENIPDLYSEGFGISEGTIVDSVYIKKLKRVVASIGMQDGVYLFKAVVNIIPLMIGIITAHPVSIFLMLIINYNRPRKS